MTSAKTSWWIKFPAILVSVTCIIILSKWGLGYYKAAAAEDKKAGDEKQAAEKEYENNRRMETRHNLREIGEIIKNIQEKEKSKRIPTMGEILKTITDEEKRSRLSVSPLTGKEYIVMDHPDVMVSDAPRDNGDTDIVFYLDKNGFATAEILDKQTWRPANGQWANSPWKK